LSGKTAERALSRLGVNRSGMYPDELRLGLEQLTNLQPLSLDPHSVSLPGSS
jgi:hypothetical protein